MLGAFAAAAAFAGPRLWAEVPLRGLAEALAWCREAMMSPSALLLHPERAQGKGSKP
jgi:hypothetical protein